MAGIAVSGIKYDDGKGGYAANCFPVRSLLRQNEEVISGGAWLVAHTAEQRRRFKAVLCTKPARTYSQIREERKRSEKEGTSIVPPLPVGSSDDEEDEKTLDGFFLMKHCCIEDPSDLCSVNISGEGLTDAKTEDFSLFDNVAYVNASENILPIESFRNFPIIRELELSLNAIRNINLEIGDFPHLEMLDLSYNNLSHGDLLSLGALPNLRVLHLSGNNLRALPADMAVRPKRTDIGSEEDNLPKGRYSQLEILLLDDNQLSDANTIASLAGLRRLKHLNLAKNEISAIPHLTVIDGRHVATAPESARSKSRRKHSARKTPRSARRSKISNEQMQPSQDLKDAGVGTTESISSLKLDEINMDDLDRKIARVIEETEKLAQTSVPSPTRAAQHEKIEEEDELDFPKVKEETFELIDINSAGPNIPPFAELVHINLSHNQISEEENLLAVAAWPMLAELVIHDNPLTTQHSGDPPLLRSFLQSRLGIRVQRKRSSPLVKPAVEVHDKPERKVNTLVPKVPKQDVEAIIAAIEAPLKRPALPPSSTTPSFTPPPKPETPQKMERHSPLPPIPATPTDDRTAAQQYEGDAFFMTQIDDMDTKQKSKSPAPLDKPDKIVQKERRKEQRPKRVKKEEREKYRGYEELLDIEEEVLYDEELPNTADVQSNVRALKYALNHPLVFRDNVVQLDKEQKPYEPFIRTKPKRAVATKTKTDKTAELLETMKARQTIMEEDLSKVLDDKPTYKHQFENADKLLGRVQHKYNAVRVSSLNDATVISKKAKAILAETLEVTQKNTKK